LCVGATKKAFDAWVGETTNQIDSSSYEGLALDALIAEQCFKGYSKKFDELRSSLLRYVRHLVLSNL
jgi:hypothetical protein